VDHGKVRRAQKPRPHTSLGSEATNSVHKHRSPADRAHPRPECRPAHPSQLVRRMIGVNLDYSRTRWQRRSEIHQSARLVRDTWLATVKIPLPGGFTLEVKRSHRRARVQVTADGRGVVSHAGARLLSDVAERSGLGADLGAALAPMVRRRRRPDPGEVLVDLAVTLADGGECISDLKVLRNQPGLFGEVASQPTAWRVLDAIDDEAWPRCKQPGRGRGPGCGRRAWPPRGGPWTSTPAWWACTPTRNARPRRTRRGSAITLSWSSWTRPARRWGQSCAQARSPPHDHRRRPSCGPR